MDRNRTLLELIPYCGSSNELHCHIRSTPASTLQWITLTYTFYSSLHPTMWIELGFTVWLHIFETQSRVQKSWIDTVLCLQLFSGLKIISRMRHCDGYISRIPMSDIIVPPAELIVEVHVLLLKTISSKFLSKCFLNNHLKAESAQRFAGRLHFFDNKAEWLSQRVLEPYPRGRWRDTIHC